MPSIQYLLIDQIVTGDLLAQQRDGLMISNRRMKMTENPSAVHTLGVQSFKSQQFIQHFVIPTKVVIKQVSCKEL